MASEMAIESEASGSCVEKIEVWIKVEDGEAGFAPGENIWG
jgi:hypothetical protein